MFHHPYCKEFSPYSYLKFLSLQLVLLPLILALHIFEKPGFIFSITSLQAAEDSHIIFSALSSPSERNPALSFFFIHPLFGCPHHEVASTELTLGFHYIFPGFLLLDTLLKYSHVWSHKSQTRECITCTNMFCFHLGLIHTLKTFLVYEIHTESYTLRIHFETFFQICYKQVYVS